MNSLYNWNHSQQDQMKDNLSQIEITISQEANNLINMIREKDAKSLVTETQDMLIQLAKCLCQNNGNLFNMVNGLSGSLFRLK
jgi:chemotaxis regulatin CheY-phosphate phosphatase CheZ